MITASITHHPLHISELNDQFTADHKGVGAIVTFVGNVRDFSHSGPIQGIELEHYPGMTERYLEQVATTSVDRFECQGVSIVHRVGRINNYDPIVWVAAASMHRRAALDAVDYAMDILKNDVPLWKKEWRDDKAHWVEQKASDRQALTRWDNDN